MSEKIIHRFIKKMGVYNLPIVAVAIRERRSSIIFCRDLHTIFFHYAAVYFDILRLWLVSGAGRLRPLPFEVVFLTEFGESWLAAIVSIILFTKKFRHVAYNKKA